LHTYSLFKDDTAPTIQSVNH